MTSSFKTLRAEIRHIVDIAEHRLTAAEIHGAVTRKTNKKIVSVTISQMLDDKQLRKRIAPKSKRARGVRFVYGIGPELVNDDWERGARRSAVNGFMEEKREREARARRKTA